MVGIEITLEWMYSHNAFHSYREIYNNMKKERYIDDFEEYVKCEHKGDLLCRSYFNSNIETRKKGWRLRGQYTYATGLQPNGWAFLLHKYSEFSIEMYN